MAKKNISKASKSSGKKGLGKKILVGSAIAAGVAVAAGILAKTKGGKKIVKKISKDIKDKSTEFQKYIVPRLKKAKKMSAAEFKEFARGLAERYSKDKKLSLTEGKHLLKEVESSFKRLKDNI